MNIEKTNKLADSLIQEYWDEFRHGCSWNYCIWKPKYYDTDTWATKNKWMDVAKQCIENNENVIQALEVLLYFDKKNILLRQKK